MLVRDWKKTRGKKKIIFTCSVSMLFPKPSDSRTVLLGVLPLPPEPSGQPGWAVPARQEEAMGSGSHSRPTPWLCFVSPQHQTTQTPVATDAGGGHSIIISPNPWKSLLSYTTGHQIARIFPESLANDGYEEGAVHGVSTGTAMFW